MPGKIGIGIAVGIGMAIGIGRADEDPLKMAEQAYAESHWREARDLATRAVAKKPLEAWRLIGASSCLLKERAAALDALGHLPSKSDGELVRFACQKAGVEITDDDAAVAQSPARADAEKAQAAYGAGKYADAKRLALQATATDPKLSVGWRVLGAASCWTKDKVTAQKACDHLQPVDQEYVRNVCTRAIGVQLKNSRVLR